MTIETHERKKLEVIVDQPHLGRVIELLESEGVRGYTVLASRLGKGSRGAWFPTRLTDAEDRVMLVAVMRDALADAVLTKLDALFAELPGVAFVSDVRVLRSERF